MPTGTRSFSSTKAKFAWENPWSSGGFLLFGFGGEQVQDDFAASGVFRFAWCHCGERECSGDRPAFASNFSWVWIAWDFGRTASWFQDRCSGRSRYCSAEIWFAKGVHGEQSWTSEPWYGWISRAWCERSQGSSCCFALGTGQGRIGFGRQLGCLGGRFQVCDCYAQPPRQDPEHRKDWKGIAQEHIWWNSNFRHVLL